MAATPLSAVGGKSSAVKPEGDVAGLGPDPHEGAPLGTEWGAGERGIPQPRPRRHRAPYSLPTPERTAHPDPRSQPKAAPRTPLPTPEGWAYPTDTPNLSHPGMGTASPRPTPCRGDGHRREGGTPALSPGDPRAPGAGADAAPPRPAPPRRTKERAPGTAAGPVARSPRPVLGARGAAAAGDAPRGGGEARRGTGSGSGEGRRGGQPGKVQSACSIRRAGSGEARHCARTHFLFTDPVPSPRSTGRHFFRARGATVSANYKGRRRRRGGIGGGWRLARQRQGRAGWRRGSRGLPPAPGRARCLTPRIAHRTSRRECVCARVCACV